MNTFESPRPNINVLADGKRSLPDWYTHFGDEQFSLSALPVFQKTLYQSYPTKRSMQLIGIGSGNALFERAISRKLQAEGWEISAVVATDLQKASLEMIPREPFPVIPVVADVTSLPGLPQYGDHTLVLSRAVEHYLPEGGVGKLIREVGKLLKPGELYVAQISSGNPVALRAFSAGLQAVSGKREHFLSLEEYKEQVARTKGSNGPLFVEIIEGFASSQPKSASELARRYLTPAFLELHNLQQNPYADEVKYINALRDSLGQQMHAGLISRENAIQQLNETIATTQAFDQFRQIFTQAVRESLEADDIKESGQGITFTDGNQDVEIDIQYPIVVWQKQ